MLGADVDTGEKNVRRGKNVLKSFGPGNCLNSLKHKNKHELSPSRAPLEIALQLWGTCKTKQLFDIEMTLTNGIGGRRAIGAARSPFAEPIVDGDAMSSLGCILILF